MQIRKNKTNRRVQFNFAKVPFNTTSLSNSHSFGQSSVHPYGCEVLRSRSHVDKSPEPRIPRDDEVVWDVKELSIGAQWPVRMEMRDTVAGI
jgi:hypothetical protein